jgi:dihydrofolate synthase / folylpolyglutamate synthase
MADGARSDHPGVQQQLDRLAALSLGGDRLGLERIRGLTDRLGRPQDQLPPVFHVAGTNGKGSTCAFLRAVLEAAGHRVHVFTSPHLVRFNERIRLAGELIGDEQLAALLEEVLDASPNIGPSFFEVTAAAAFLAFSRTPADALVLEVGMGGRLDATNIVDRPLVTGIASLGFDHQQWLGSTLPEIAGEKAGIAKPDVPLVTLAYDGSAEERIRTIARERGARPIIQRREWDVTSCPEGFLYRDSVGELQLPQPSLSGEHQLLNAGLATAMLRHQGALEVGAEALRAGLAQAQWPARLHMLKDGPLASGRTVFLDGGHNAEAAQVLARAMIPHAPFTLIAGCLRTKDARGVLQPFRGLTRKLLTVPVPHQDCYSPEELASIAEAQGLAATASGDVVAAVRAASPDRPILIAGSLYLAGEVLRLNEEIPV